MKDSFYLVFSEDGIEKMNKVQKPSLKSGQRGVEMTVEIPDVFFDEPFTKVSVEFEESQVTEPALEVQVQESKVTIIRRIRQILDGFNGERRLGAERRIANTEGNDTIEAIRGDNRAREETSTSSLVAALEIVDEVANEALPIDIQA